MFLSSSCSHQPSELFLNTLQLGFGHFSTLQGSSEFVLLDAQLSAQFIELLFIVRSHLCCLAKVFVVFLNGDFIVHAGGLHNFHFLQDVVGFLGSVCKLCHGASKILLRFLGFLLHEHDSTGKG